MAKSFSPLASVFVFESFHFDPTTGEIVYRYTTDAGHIFTHTLIYKGKSPHDSTSIAPHLFALGMAELPHFWKATLAPRIVIKAGHLTNAQIQFWHTLYEKGLGEFFYKNNIDFRNIFTVSIEKGSPTHEPIQSAGTGVLVPFGGGKDSLVTGELLKKGGHSFSWFELEPLAQAEKIKKVSGVQESIYVERNVTNNFASVVDLVAKGAPNGHVPITATYMFSSVVAAALAGARDVVFSLERSANEGNLTYLGETINHQYSKSLEFEEAASRYINTYVDPHVRVFSLLRPLYEIQILKHFTTYPQYFDSFISCNKGLQNGVWCRSCAKCAFMFAGLSALLPPQEVENIFGGNMFHDTNLIPLYKELAGIQGFKPFDCVGTVEENMLALYLAKERYKRENDTVPPVLEALDVKHGAAHMHLLSDKTNDHYVPPEYTAPKPL